MRISSRACWAAALTLGGFSALLLTFFGGFFSVASVPLIFALNPWLIVLLAIIRTSGALIGKFILIGPFDMLSELVIFAAPFDTSFSDHQNIDVIGNPIILILLQIIFWRWIFIFSNKEFLSNEAKRKEKKIMLYSFFSIILVFLLAFAFVYFGYYERESYRSGMLVKTSEDIKLMLENKDTNYCESIPIMETYGFEAQRICYFVGALLTKNISNCFNVHEHESLCISLVEESMKNQFSSQMCEYEHSEDVNGLKKSACSLYLGIYLQDKSLCNNAGYDSWICHGYIFS